MLSNPDQQIALQAEQPQWLEAQLQLLRNSLRTGQYWRGGEMAVSAVPGAGKSHSLSVAAAIAIAQNHLHSRRQLVGERKNLKGKYLSCDQQQPLTRLIGSLLFGIEFDNHQLYNARVLIYFPLMAFRIDRDFDQLKSAPQDN